MAPENTLAAFSIALEVGADAIDLDVRLSWDRHVVVLHDRLLDRTTNGSGPVGTYTLKELRTLDAGSWFGPRFAGEPVPALDDVFDALPQDFPVYVEMKSRGHGAWRLASGVVQVIRRHARLESTMVASFNPLGMAFIRALEPRITRGYISSGRHPLPLRARWLSPLVNPHWYAPDRGTLTPKLLARFHAQGKPVAAWVVDTGADMGRLGEMGIDAVVTDYPEELVLRG